MTAEEFEREYAERSGITGAQLRFIDRIVAPCECGDASCEGFRSVNRFTYADELDCAFDLHASQCARCRAADYCPTGLKLTLAAIELRKPRQTPPLLAER